MGGGLQGYGHVMKSLVLCRVSLHPKYEAGISRSAPPWCCGFGVWFSFRFGIRLDRAVAATKSDTELGHSLVVGCCGVLFIASKFATVLIFCRLPEDSASFS